MWRSACKRTRPQLPLLAGGDLLGPDRRRVERHLLGCAACRGRLSALTLAVDVLHAAAALDPVPAGAPSLWPELAREIRESRRPHRASWPRRLAWPAVGLAASVALAALSWTTLATSLQPVARRQNTPLAQWKPDVAPRFAAEPSVAAAPSDEAPEPDAAPSPAVSTSTSTPAPVRRPEVARRGGPQPAADPHETQPTR